MRNSGLCKQMLNMVLERSTSAGFPAVQNTQGRMDEIVDIFEKLSCNRVLAYDAFDELKKLILSLDRSQQSFIRW